MKIIIRIAVCAMLLLCCALLCRCADENGGAVETGTVSETGAASDELVITSGGECFYTVVRADYADQTDISTAVNLCSAIENAAGVRPKITTDWKDNPVEEREIVIGETAREQTEGHAIDRISLGSEGYIIEAAGGRVYIAGGSSDATAAAVNKFIKTFVNGTEIKIDADYVYSVCQQFDIGSLTISGAPLSEYVIIYDDTSECRNASEALAEILWEKTGVKPDIAAGTPSDYDKAIYIASSKPSENGIHVVENTGGTLTFSSSASTGVGACVERFAAKYLSDAYGDYDIPDGFIYVGAGDYIIVSDPRER